MIDGHLGTRVVITTKDINTQDKRKLENWIESNESHQDSIESGGKPKM